MTGAFYPSASDERPISFSFSVTFSFYRCCPSRSRISNWVDDLAWVAVKPIRFYGAHKCTVDKHNDYSSRDYSDFSSLASSLGLDLFAHERIRMSRESCFRRK